MREIVHLVIVSKDGTIIPYSDIEIVALSGRQITELLDYTVESEIYDTAVKMYERNIQTFETDDRDD